MGAVEYVCIFVRASPERLRAAERFVLALPRLLGGSLAEIDLRYQADATLLGVFVRMHAEGLVKAKCERLVFWTARAGGRAMAGASMSPEDRNRVGTYLSRPSKSLAGIEAPALLDATGSFFTELGAPPERRRSLDDRPQLVLDVGGRGWEGARWSAAEARLFVAAPLAPPVGDEFPLLLRVPGSRPVEGHCAVVEVRPKLAAVPGKPAGYTLQLENPPAPLVELLSRMAGSSVVDSRSAPRYRVTAPIKVTPSPEPAHAVIEYANDRELAEDFVSNLSEGGAFIRTLCPLPMGAPMELELRLPNGADLHARAAVVFVNSEGMGVQFHLDPVAEAVLDSAIAHISGQRRALVVDDDALVQRLYSDALRERGYEVLTASNAAEGIQILSDELLSLDILLTDMVMPGMNGEEFVRLIRRTGGEAELAIVCVTGQHEGGLEQRLESAGADAVLDKALGPELIAQAADAVLERKRILATP